MCLLVKIHILAVLLISFYTVAETFEDPRNEFFNHAVIKPELFPLVTPRSRPGLMQAHTEEDMKLVFNAFEQKFEVNLRENKELFSPNYVEIYEENGEEKIYQPINERERKCYYKGHVPSVKGSWAAISTCNGISGVVHDGKETYYIEPNQLSTSGEHLVFKASDKKDRSSRCGVNGFSSPFEKNIRMQNVQLKSDLLEEVANQTQKRYIESIIINDNSMYKKYKTLTATNDRAKQVVNAASAMYSSLNIVITILKVKTWTTQDPISVTRSSDDTLDNFVHYRKNTLLPAEPNDNALLLSDVRFSGGVVGVAYVAQMCTKGYSAVLTRDSTIILGEVAATYAHELGHNLGMDHDRSSCSCPDRFCIMYYATTPVPPTKWSSCSKSELNAFLKTHTANCLLNVP